MRKRSKHSLNNYRMHTAEMGQLFPIGCVPVLPGDTIQHTTSALVRVAPLNTPVMHPCNVRIHHWYVPYRVLWPESENGGWEQFITGGPDGQNAQTVPTVTLPAGTDKKALSSYLGVPPPTTNPVTVSALPLRAYNLIYNQRYRDQDVVAEAASESNLIRVCAWEKDYFTTARPFSAKGPQVTLPIGDQAPVKGIGIDQPSANQNTNTTVRESDGSTPTYAWTSDAAGGLGSVFLDAIAGAGGDPNVYADLSQAGSININDFRAGFALQRYQEARARYGSRFTEYLRYCGVTPSDARLQEPEFLGGGTTRLNFSEVLQTTPGGVGEAGVGDLYGHGISGVRSNTYRKFFEEHGVVISLMSVRPKAIYLNGTHREWFKTAKEDFFQKELANLGQQEVYTGELDSDTVAPTNTFGFQDRYDEYRQHWSLIGQDFRDTLSSWHLGRDLTNPVLNASFIGCVPSTRIYQVTEGDHLWVMANHKMMARRMVPGRANPRII